MARKPLYFLAFDSDTVEHLRVIDTKYHSLIRKTIRDQLQFEPETETRNRKPLKRPTKLGATWELRFGPNNRFRVLYAVDRENRKVQILAIGTKENNQLLFGGKEIEL